MPKAKWNLNTIYISERLQESLRPISRCALTTVVAPMGYGKTTAINWYLNERGREGAAVLRVSIYSANRAIFWKSLQKAFAQAGLTVLEGYECPTDASGAALLLDDLCTALAGERRSISFWMTSICSGTSRPPRSSVRWPTACRATPTSWWPAGTISCPRARSSAWGSGSTGWGPTSCG